MVEDEKTRGEADSDEHDSYAEDLAALLRETYTEVQLLIDKASLALRAGDLSAAEAQISAGKTILDVAKASMRKSGIPMEA